MSVLVFAGPQTIGRLAAAEGVRSPTMTALVNGLVEAGLARRRTGTGDGRSVVVEATPKGRQLLTQGRTRRVSVLNQLLADFTDDELERLQRAAELIERALADRPEQLRRFSGNVSPQPFLRGSGQATGDTD